MSRAAKRASLCEYKNKINDLESEVGTLKQRLDELRRAKNKIINKQEPVRRTSVTRKLSVEEDEKAAETITHLSNRVIALQNELELLQCKYNQDSGILNETIRQLSLDIANLKSCHTTHITQTTQEHFVDLEKLKKSHVEELALLTEKCEKGEIRAQAAEQELVNYKAKVRLVSAADLNILKSELSRMREEYSKLKEDNEEEVERLEDTIAVLVLERQEWQAKQEEDEAERSTRKLQLIPDRPKTAGVRKSSPLRSSSPKASDRSVFVKTSKVMQRPKSCIERSNTDVNFQRRNVTHGNYINSEKKWDRGEEECSDQSINSASSITRDITHYPALQQLQPKPRTVSDKWNGAVRQVSKVDKMNKSFPSFNNTNGVAKGRVYNGASKDGWQPQKRRARNYVQNMNL